MSSVEPVPGLVRQSSQPPDLPSPGGWDPGPVPVSRPGLVLRTLVSLLLAFAVVGLFVVLGSGTAVDQALQVMGFDPDRAHLLTALVAGGLVAATVALSGGATLIGVIASVLASTGYFGRTFIHETRAALTSSGTQGSFDAVGWTVSVITLLFVAVVVGWASAALAGIIRRSLVEAGRSARRFVFERPRRLRLAGFPLFVVATAVLLVITLPVFADMINYDPNVHMLGGGNAPVGLVGGPDGGESPGGSFPGGAIGSVAPGGSRSSPGTPSGLPSPEGSNVPGGGEQNPDPAAASLSLPRDLVAGRLPGSLVTPGALSAGRPWTSSPPTGPGTVDRITLPGPWTGGVSSTADIEIYLPPGYAASSMHYATLYEAPISIDKYVGGANATGQLDALITGGELPPVIIVFAQSDGGPYADSECANSRDGTEWFDRYMASTVVPYVDAHYRTIATPEARATLGFSQGGYCAAAILAHHPDVFRSAAIFSGYYISGIRSSNTPSAWRPFADNASYMASTSPMTVIPTLSASVASSLFFSFEGDPTNPFYGVQLQRFTRVLDQSGTPMAIFPTPLGHAWTAVRAFLPSMLETIAARMTDLGVYGGS